MLIALLTGQGHIGASQSYLFRHHTVLPTTTSESYTSPGSTYILNNNKCTITFMLFTNIYKSNCTEVEYDIKHAHSTNVKHINTIQKLVPSALLPYTNWQIKLRDAGTTGRSVWRFNTRFLKTKKNGQTQSQIRNTI